jgi:hypothetical protein
MVVFIVLIAWRHDLSPLLLIHFSLGGMGMQVVFFINHFAARTVLAAEPMQSQNFRFYASVSLQKSGFFVKSGRAKS